MSRPTHLTARLGVLIGLVVAAALASGDSATSAREAGTPEPARVMGPQSCAECHESEFRVWESTAHQEGSRTLTRNPESRRMAEVLGIRRLKSDARCTSCHYTVQATESRPRAVAGVSCESCHGPAIDWLDHHDDFGGPDRTAETESEEHRAQRRALCDEFGMIRPDRLISMAEQCYRCHVIADEELVDVAGHPTGAGFELVSWSQGEVRHNFIRGGGTENPPSAVERLRKMYVVGQMLELKHAVAGLVRTSGSGECADELRARATKAARELERICESTKLPEAEMIVAEIEATPLESLDQERVDGFIASIEECLMKFEAMNDGSELGGLDALIPEVDPEAPHGEE